MNCRRPLSRPLRTAARTKNRGASNGSVAHLAPVDHRDRPYRRLQAVIDRSRAPDPRCRRRDWMCTDFPAAPSGAGAERRLGNAYLHHRILEPILHNVDRSGTPGLCGLRDGFVQRPVHPRDAFRSRYSGDLADRERAADRLLVGKISCADLERPDSRLDDQNFGRCLSDCNRVCST